MGEGEGERRRFLPPTAHPPRYAHEPAPAPGAPPAPPAPPAPAVPGRNYSVVDPGAPRFVSTQTPPPVAAEPDNPLAVASITLGVIGLLLLLSFFGILVVNLPCSVLAWVLGSRARLRAGRESMAQAGRVTGIVGTALGSLAVVLWGALALAAA